MAKRRLNKKVALIGSAVFVVLGLVAICVLLYLSRNPEKFIEDAETALESKDYKRAISNYWGAYDRAKGDSLKEEILFKLADAYRDSGQFNYMPRCWDEIIRINPTNARARYGRLQYFYIWADSGGSGAWKQVSSQATEFIAVAEQENLLMEETSQWEVPGLQDKPYKENRLGPYLYLVRGRAALEMTQRGEVTDKNESLARAVDDLKKVQKLEPNNVDAFWNLARTAVLRGEVFAETGNFQERDKALEEAEALLKQAVEIADADPRSYVNYLSLKLGLARRGSSPEEQIKSLEGEYLSFAEKFPSSAEASAAVAHFYSVYSANSGPQLGPANLDKAIEASDRAIELDAENVAYAISSADYHYRKYAVFGEKAQIQKAIEKATKGLTLPGAQDVSGPRSGANRIHRLSLHYLLANCYIEQVLESGQERTGGQSQQWLAEAEKSVHVIEQILGSAEHPQVIRWRGMLELARGNNKTAVKQLYAAYEQLKAVKPAQPPWPADAQFAHLSYSLAKVLEDSSESGAIAEFLTSALNSYISDINPEARLDYVETVMNFNRWSDALENIGVYERRMGRTERSNTLRIRVYIRAGQSDEAAKALAEMPQDQANTIKLSLELAQTKIRQIRMAIAQQRKRDDLSGLIQTTEGTITDPGASVQLMIDDLNSYKELEAKLVGKLLAMDPNSVELNSVLSVCNAYVAENETGKAKSLTAQFLQHFPDDTGALIYAATLEEPEPGNISAQRRVEIEEQVLMSLKDPAQRSLKLGVFYRRRGDLKKAAEELNKVLFDLSSPRESAPESEAFVRTEETDVRRSAAGHLFDVAMATEDWVLAEKVLKVAQEEDLDSCEGMVYEARLAMANGDYDDALGKVDACLKQRPVFSRAYMLRSSINTARGNELTSLQDIQKAASLNPLDGTIAKGLADKLYRRNRALGDAVSPSQVVETRAALERAIALNPTDSQLLSVYAAFISPTETLRAVAILQQLQKLAPSLNNALQLGQMALKLAKEAADENRKDAFYAVAGSAFEQARQIDPESQMALLYYTEYLRQTGQNDKARDVLEQSKSDRLLWYHYFQRGQYEEARGTLEQLYGSNPKDAEVVKGLLLVAEKTNDKENVQKYSEELVSIDTTVARNHLIQIQSFLRVGLVKEAEYKLARFTESFPDEPKTMLLKAWLAMRQGQLQKALELTNRYLETNQSDAAAWRLRGEINFFMADFNQAINDLKRSKSYSDDPVTRMTLAKAYLQTRRYEDAITELKNAIEAPGAPPEVRELLEHTYLRLGNSEPLKKLYADTLKTYPDSVRWHNRAGAFGINTGDFNQAEQLYQKAYETKRRQYAQTSGDWAGDAEYATAFDGYLKALILQAGMPGETNWDPKKLDRVFEESSGYLDGAFAPIAYLRMAQAKLKLADKETAVDYCQKAVDKAGENEALASEVLLRMFLMLGPDEVLKYCQQKLIRDPDSIAAHFTMFNLYKIRGEFRRALEHIDVCVELSEPNSVRRVDYTAKKAEVLTLAYDRSSDKSFLDMAIGDYESLLKKMPKNTSVLNNLAYMLAEKDERLPEALGYAERAVDLRPNDPSLLDTYGYVLHKNGKNSRALELLTAALQQFEQNNVLAPAELHEHLGMAREGLGQKSEALAAYRQALQVGADTMSAKVKERIDKAVERLSQ